MFRLRSTTVEKDPEPPLPIGNLTSHFFANLYLSELDHFVLENLKPFGYCRYMDDFILFSNSKIDLKKMLNSIESFCINNLLLGFFYILSADIFRLKTIIASVKSPTA